MTVDKGTDSLEKTLMLGKIDAGGEGDDRRQGGWMAQLNSVFSILYLRNRTS